MTRDLYGNLIKTDFWGKNIPKKQLKREVLEDNKRRGKSAEDIFVFRAQLAGYEVERTGIGHDFRLRKRNLFTGRVTYTGLREVKSGNASLSRLQKKIKKEHSNYKVVREDPGLIF